MASHFPPVTFYNAVDYVTEKGFIVSEEACGFGGRGGEGVMTGGRSFAIGVEVELVDAAIGAPTGAAGVHCCCSLSH
jgi:hypothetical protein